MKTILLLVTLLPLISFSQTKTTIANGDFYNPIVWDCFCLPASGDNLIINHDLIMYTDIYYTAGQILSHLLKNLPTNKIALLKPQD